MMAFISFSTKPCINGFEFRFVIYIPFTCDFYSISNVYFMSKKKSPCFHFEFSTYVYSTWRLFYKSFFASFQSPRLVIWGKKCRKVISPMVHQGFPDGSDGKKSACNVGDLGLTPGLGRSPGGGNGNPLQYSCLENSMDRGYSPWDHKESDMTEWLILPLSFTWYTTALIAREPLHKMVCLMGLNGQRDLLLISIHNSAFINLYGPLQVLTFFTFWL